MLQSSERLLTVRRTASFLTTGCPLKLGGLFSPRILLSWNLIADRTKGEVSYCVLSSRCIYCVLLGLLETDYGCSTVVLIKNDALETSPYDTSLS